MLELLANPSLKRFIVTIATAAVVALNKKLGLSLEVADVASIVALAVAFLGQSALKEVKLAGVDAAAKVATVNDAAKELSK